MDVSQIISHLYTMINHYSTQTLQTQMTRTKYLSQRAKFLISSISQGSGGKQGKRMGQQEVRYLHFDHYLQVSHIPPNSCTIELSATHLILQKWESRHAVTARQSYLFGIYHVQIHDTFHLLNE